MEVEYTGRQAVVTDELRAMTQQALERIEKLAGKANSAHVILTTIKYRHTAEITIKTSLQDIVGVCESTTMESALRQALEKAEHQAIRGKEKLKARNRVPTGERASVQPGLERPSRAARVSPITTSTGDANPLAAREHGKENGNGNGGLSLVASAEPASFAQLDTEPHLVRTIDAIALRPMSLEEAIKEAEFRDREVFVFRDGGGQVKVLHRKRDGLMELIELPA